MADDKAASAPEDKGPSKAEVKAEAKAATKEHETTLADAKEVENERASVEDVNADEDEELTDPMADAVDSQGLPIVGVSADMYRPAYIHKSKD